MKVAKLFKKVLATVLAVSLVAGSVSIPAKAADTFNYVTLGASNTNGYGLRGYITDEEINMILSGQASKNDINVYGYQRSPEGAYTDLVRDYYAGKGKAVDLSQLAISSMRAEEIRILLDDTYMGDDYSQWRFTGSNGWFYSAERGNAADNTEALANLRKAYKDSIVNSDLVTVDIGWNNFGVYICNQLVEYLEKGKLMWGTDLADVYETAEELAAGEEAKKLIGAYIESYVGAGEVADVITDIFAYSLLGYMYHFDIVMEKIYELNPDADVVVLGIQNLLHGIVVELGGEQIPLGDIFGNFVNMANYYISAVSPYQGKYQYVKAGGDDEHVTLFIDDIKSYNGNGKDLNQNVKDCFDYYDSDLYVQTKMDSIAADMIEQEFGDQLSLIGCNNGAEAVALGKEGKLNDGMGSMVDAQGTFDSMYWPALYAAYDTLARIVKEVGNYETVVADGLFSGVADVGTLADTLAELIFAEVQENALAAADGGTYTVDIAKVLPDDVTKVVAAIYIRFYLGDSFFAHPSENGHKEIKDAIVGVIENPASEKDQYLDAHLVKTMEDIQKLFNGEAEHEHDLDETLVKATTKKNGKIEKVCKTCGEMVESQVIYYPKTIKLSKTSFVYNNKVQKPTVTVTDSNGKKIAAKNNYDVKVVNAKKAVGQYTVKITFKGNYSGTVSKTYKIVPKGTTVSKLTNAKKAITVKWKKQATQTTGYEIQMATDKAFTKNKKLTTVAKTATVSKKVTGLKAKTKYFVRIRTYKTVKINGKSTKIYSAWSAAKNVKTK